jgi:hypothetical protein
MKIAGDCNSQARKTFNGKAPPDYTILGTSI